MKKTLLTISMAIALSWTAKAESWGAVTAYTSCATAIEQAQAQQKLLFIVTGKASCGHCVDLKNAIIKNSDLVNANCVVYYCISGKDKTMPSSSLPRWGIYNPYTFDPSERWNNKDEYYDQRGYSDASEYKLISAIQNAAEIWATVDKSQSGGSSVVTSEEKASSDDATDDSSSSKTKKIITTPTATMLGFYLDMDEFPETLKGNTVLTQFLPTIERMEAVELTEKLKMETEKAVKITYNRKKGLVVGDEDGNLSGLKLSYNKKTGVFKGTFKIYTQNSRGTLKKLTAKITNGVYKNGEGTATAKILGCAGSLPVKLVAVDAE